MPCRRRGRTVPASVADLDFEAAGRELMRTGGNVSAAARAIGVPVGDLRLLVYARPELLDAALEAEELALDESEAQLLEGRDQPIRILEAWGVVRKAAGSVNLSDQGRERSSSPRDLMLPRRPLAMCSSPQRGRLGRSVVSLDDAER
jgi:hypothetical protein